MPQNKTTAKPAVKKKSAPAKKAPAKKTAAKKAPVKKAAPAKKTPVAGKKAQLYAVGYGSKPNTLKMTKTSDVSMSHDVTHMVSYMIGNNSYLLAYSNKSHHYTMYKVNDGGKGFTKTGDGVLNYK